MTRTFATLEISSEAYDEIAAKLHAAGYDHSFVDGYIDGHGIGLARGKDEPASINFIFARDGSHPQLRFVEIEGPDGKSIQIGSWRMREDGLYELHLPPRVQRDHEERVSELLAANNIEVDRRRDAVAQVRILENLISSVDNCLASITRDIDNQDPSIATRDKVRQAVVALRGVLSSSCATSESVFPDWMATLPMQQQSVLVLAARGPDGVRKYHECKDVVRAYRATVLKAAYFGRSLAWGEGADGFMSMDVIADDLGWRNAVLRFFASVDELPHHYYLHLAHGAEILGYKHPDMRVRNAWRHFYEKCCDDMHVTPETEAEMERRLGDWGQAHWCEAPNVQATEG